MFSRYLESNLVYPLEKGYYYIVKLDEKWVLEEIKKEYNAIDISNKYCVCLLSKGVELLVTNHDGTFWLTMKLESKNK